MEVKILRVEKSEDGTFGVLLINEKVFCLTLERPWADNTPGVSCVPPGKYFCNRTISPKFGDTFELMSVPGRSNILFHWGNYIEDTQGCILLGYGFENPPAQRGVFNSRKTFACFMAAMLGIDNFWLEIV